MTPLKPPFPWFGGKTRAAHLIWPRLGDVPNYVEPFAGGLAVLLARPHEPRIETVNDLDCHLANFWRATQRDPEAVAHWCDWPVNEADLHARHRWLVTTGAERVERLKSDPDYYDPQVAGWWVWGVCLWIGGGWCKRLWQLVVAVVLGDSDRLHQRDPSGVDEQLQLGSCDGGFCFL